MASLHIAQIIGERKTVIDEQVKTFWTWTDTFSKKNNIIYTNDEYNLIIGNVNNKNLLFNYFSIQGVPGTTITVNTINNGQVGLKIGRTGILEVPIYNDNFIKQITVEPEHLQETDSEYYHYNNKYIIDIIYTYKEEREKGG